MSVLYTFFEDALTMFVNSGVDVGYRIHRFQYCQKVMILRYWYWYNTVCNGCQLSIVLSAVEQRHRHYCEIIFCVIANVFSLLW